MRILMVAAENDALPGGKVGGIGDVLRDIPVALAELDHEVQVVTPGYGAFSKLPGAEHAADVQVYFAGFPQLVSLYRVSARNKCDGVKLWAMEHPVFSSCGEGLIYCDDGDTRPFATDANKFALFCMAVCRAIENGVFGELDVIHLHDWHAAMVALLAELDPQFTKLNNIHRVFTVHNLALQGTRPLEGDDSSPARWFKHLAINDSRVLDPRAQNCINPMRAGINLCHRVHVVSPGYAEEVVRPSDPASGFSGGEGLHDDLKQAFDNGRLYGILNGCDYDAAAPAALDWQALLTLCEQELRLLVARETAVKSSHMLALRAVDRHRAGTSGPKSRLLLTSVGRLTGQKVNLLLQQTGDGRSALAHMLEALGDKGVFVMLGSGDARLERAMTRHAAEFDNFIYVEGYAEQLANALYVGGNLFLMPSSYEPCGISQMLAMRAGQPCFVHHIGGLGDTVEDGVTGFSFNANDKQDAVTAMLERFDQVLQVYQQDKPGWKKIAEAARKVRFTWRQAAERYNKFLYKH
ncbi:MAG: glycogen/starch synthase [Gammaproteobacteria bacterium]|nr:glycogen/starch synthase [Gammaproteobacteria bacterium]MBT8151197.1 glycogen/starch synthase [Gammaproteobacteria bacterium]NND39019.1 glycosyltransferase [Pseudomonadales bacterium]NNM10484.1 glycosyltransferase [Pseudomonadales bacterium]RZV51177.1 MAG: glycogen synthase [Pseudomonadales bacterium]